MYLYYGKKNFTHTFQIRRFIITFKQFIPRHKTITRMCFTLKLAKRDKYYKLTDKEL